MPASPNISSSRLSGALVTRACKAILTGEMEQRALRTGSLILTLGARGGSGATTIAIRLAWHLAQTRSRRVIFLDFDLRTGDASLQLDVTAQHALREALEHPERMDDLFLERGVIHVSERFEPSGLRRAAGLCKQVQRRRRS